MKKILLILGCSSFLLATDGAMLFSKCSACHGMNAEKKALGKDTNLFKYSSEKDFKDAILSYRNGKKDLFGFGSLMKTQVVNLSDQDISNIYSYLQKINNN